MKKQFLALAFLGLCLSPFTSMQAALSDQDLQKMSANKMENKALGNLQSFVAFCAMLTTIATCGGIAVTVDANTPHRPLAGTLTAGLGVASAALIKGWYEIFKNRAERHGYKNDKLKFFFVDLMSSMEGQVQVYVH